MQYGGVLAVPVPNELYELRELERHPCESSSKVHLTLLASSNRVMVYHRANWYLQLDCTRTYNTGGPINTAPLIQIFAGTNPRDMRLMDSVHEGSLTVMRVPTVAPAPTFVGIVPEITPHSALHIP